MMRFADIKQACETLPQPPEFGLVFLFGIVNMFEFACGVNVVTGVDAHFFHYLCRRIRYIGLKMHIGDKGHSDLPNPSKGGANRKRFFLQNVN